MRPTTPDLPNWPDVQTCAAYQALRVDWEALDYVGKHADKGDAELAALLRLHYHSRFPGVTWGAVARALRERN